MKFNVVVKAFHITTPSPDKETKPDNIAVVQATKGTDAGRRTYEIPVGDKVYAVGEKLKAYYYMSGKITLGER